MSRRYPEKPVAGVGVVVRQGDKVLLVRRGRQPSLNNWSIPGGAQNLGETLAEAAEREVLEETGATIEIVGLLGVVDMIDRDSRGAIRYHYTLVDFTARWISGEIAPADDVREVTWASLRQLGDYNLLPQTEQFIRLSQLGDKVIPQYLSIDIGD